jgi:MFS family permease
MHETVTAPRYRLASFPLLMTISVLTRLLVNTANQLFNPFLTIIAAGLGIDVITLGQLLGLRSSMAVFAPFWGALADRWGYRLILRLELLTGIGGLLLVGSSIHLWMTVAGMVLLGLGFYAFVPTLRAYLAEQLPYHRRARLWHFGIFLGAIRHCRSFCHGPGDRAGWLARPVLWVVRRVGGGVGCLCRIATYGPHTSGESGSIDRTAWAVVG